MVVNGFVEAWIFEIMRAVGRFFLHPAVYVFLISSIFVGYLRMLRERKDFSFKVYDIWFELRTALFAGIGYGLVVSIITIGLGLVVSKANMGHFTLDITIWINCYVPIFISSLYV